MLNVVSVRMPLWALLTGLSVAQLTAQESDGAILGQVSDFLGRPVPGVSVVLEGRAAEVRTDSDGQFRVAGLTTGVYLFTFLHVDFLPRTFRFTLTTGDRKELSAGLIMLQGRRRGTIVLRGTVTDSLTREPLAGVAVGVADEVSTFTGRDGTFRIGDVESGMVMLQATRLGYQPIAVDLELIHDGWVDLAIQLVPRPFLLEGLRVEVDENFLSFGPLRQLYQRRQRGQGYSFLRWEIEEENPLYLTDLFRMIPGVRVKTNTLGEHSVTWRGCGPTLYLDGMLLDADDRLEDLVTPAEVEALEVHLGAYSPPEFHNFNACGVIAVWRR